MWIAQALAFLQPLFLRNKLWGLLIRHDTPSHPSRFASLRPQSKGSWCAEREDLLFSYFRCVYYKAQHPFTKLERSLDMDVVAFSYFPDIISIISLNLRRLFICFWIKRALG